MMMSAPDHIDFQCNCCGTNQHTAINKMQRENASCFECGSSVRMRGIAHHIAMAIFQQPLILSEFPVTKTVWGIGMSDWEGYARHFQRTFSYRNTFFHQEPYLDIGQPLEPSLLGRFDFVIATEVFEHVFPPVANAFANLFALLKPGGMLVFTVPYTLAGATREHFPGCSAGKTVEVDGSWAFVYKDGSGSLKLATDLSFHGGPGSTLEMREFALCDLISNLETAGFCNIQVQDGEYPPFGIINLHKLGHPITAWKPLSRA